jgi:hypothetical protein
MAKFTVDYTDVEHKIYKKAYKLADVKDQLETVAFDIVRFKDGDKGADLWQIQSAEDGDYIVSIYEEDNDELKASAAWEVFLSKAAGYLQISYKGEPLVKIAGSTLGIPANELHKVPNYLPSKLAGNKKLVNSLLNQLSTSAKKEVLKKYPELV